MPIKKEKAASYIVDLLPYVLCILIVLILLFIALRIPYLINKHIVQEKFTNPDESADNVSSDNMNNKIVVKKNDDIYDKFYSKIYEKIVGEYTSYRVEFEVSDLYRNGALEKYGKKTRLLEMGCGIGEHISQLAKDGFKIVGLDQSSYMLDIARDKIKKYKNVRLIEGDMDNGSLFGKSEFTHITCYYFSVYYTSDLEKLLNNVNKWLTSMGYFVVHLVDKYKFDPVLDAASPFPAFSFQKYSEKRKNKSIIHFDKFSYESEFKAGKGDDAVFIETIKYPDRDYTRKHYHKMYMPNLNKMVKIIKSHGFQLVHTSHMVDIGYEYQYLCYFQKKR